MLLSSSMMAFLSPDYRLFLGWHDLNLFHIYGNHGLYLNTTVLDQIAIELIWRYSPGFDAQEVLEGGNTI